MGEKCSEFVGHLTSLRCCRCRMRVLRRTEGIAPFEIPLPACGGASEWARALSRPTSRSTISSRPALRSFPLGFDRGRIYSNIDHMASKIARLESQKMDRTARKTQVQKARILIAKPGPEAREPSPARPNHSHVASASVGRPLPAIVSFH